MGVRAKFFISSIVLSPGSSGGVVNLSAASRGARNAEWAAASPSGTMTITINNPPALAFFEDLLRASRETGYQPEVFLDITVANDGLPGDGHAFEVSDVSENHYTYGKCAACGMGKDDKLTYRPGTSETLDDPISAHPNG